METGSQDRNGEVMSAIAELDKVAADAKISVSQPIFLVMCQRYVTQWMAKTTVPVSTQGLPVYRNRQVDLKIPIWGLPVLK
jgi:hypothetical protein